MNTAIVFPGQGSQYDSMGQELYKNYQIARDLYNEASDILGYDLLKACENNNGELRNTVIVQPAILVYSIACWEIFKKNNDVKQLYLTGHSLGELSAVVAADGIPFAKAVELVKLRATAMSECTQDGGMVVCFGLNGEEVEAVCQRIDTDNNHVTVANFNSTNQIVLSGHKNALEQASIELQKKGAVTKILPVSVPAHSRLMKPAEKRFQAALQQTQMNDCRYPIFSCASGQLYSRADEIADQLSRQLTESVRWPKVMDVLINKDVGTFIEMGPKTILTDIMKMEYPDYRAIPVNEKNGIHSILNNLNENTFKIEETIHFLQACLRVIIGTPFKEKIDKQDFEKEIHSPYQIIKQELKEMKESKQMTVESHRVASLSQQFFSILMHKGFPKNETLEFLKLSIANPNLYSKYLKINASK